MRLSREGEVFVLDLGDDENRFGPTWLDGIEAALTEVEQTEGPRALITTATGKFWSNGLDLDWLFGHPDDAGAYVDRVHALFARVLTLPVPTVAAVQGHCFAAGAMLSLVPRLDASCGSTAASGACPRSTSRSRSPSGWAR